MIDAHFTCALCGGDFISDWTEEEALEEKNRNWGDMPLEDMAVLCDDCHTNFMAKMFPNGANQ